MSAGDHSVDLLRATNPVWPEAADLPLTGIMAVKIRLFDWSRTSLGPIDTWPEALLMNLQVCLDSKFPMHIWWGPGLVNLYNDAFIPILGLRHPSALGGHADEIWSDAWPSVGPLVRSVMDHGRSTWTERGHFVLFRNGFPEEAWFTWSYAPIRSNGKILGLICTCMEETGRVLTEKSKERLSDEALRTVADRSARGILESITEAFFSLDSDWRFTYLNPPSLLLLGRPPEELIGKSLWEEYPSLIGSVFEPIYRGVADSRRSSSIVAFFSTHNRWYDVRAYAAEDGGLSVYFRDVTAEKGIEFEREKIWASERLARSEAERAGRLKDEFLATLGHELRTPLNSVLGWCDILGRADMRSPEEISEGIKTIERNARAQAQIIADILDMSSIIAGKMRVVFRVTNLAVQLKEAVETAKPAAEAKGVHLTLHLSVDSSLSRIKGDPNRLQQIFWNLLSNSLKFTLKGGFVEAHLVKVDSHFEVSIRDSGKGIDSDFIPLVFDRFRQADSSTTRLHGGLGLGLSIARQLVELHGGTISVKSDGLGKGSCFTATFPMSSAQVPEDIPLEKRRQPKPALSIPLSDGSVRGLKVLVVDDEFDARTLVKRLLEDYGALAVVAGSAREAVELLATERPDVLVSDIGMSGEDGYSLIRRIRALPPSEGGDTPALALTAYARQEDRERAVLAGFQLHISKPVEPLELVLSVASLAVREASNFRSGFTGVALAEPEAAQMLSVRVLLVEDHPSTREIIKLLLVRRGHKVVDAGCLADARAAAENNQFDLLISDVGLPDGTGNDLMRDLKARFGLRGVAMSGFGDVDDLARSEAAGFVAHLTKPVNLGALEAAVQGAMAIPLGR